MKTGFLNQALREGSRSSQLAANIDGAPDASQVCDLMSIRTADPISATVICALTPLALPAPPHMQTLPRGNPSKHLRPKTTQRPPCLSPSPEEQTSRETTEVMLLTRESYKAPQVQVIPSPGTFLIRQQQRLRRLIGQNPQSFFSIPSCSLLVLVRIRKNPRGFLFPSLSKSSAPNERWACHLAMYWPPASASRGTGCPA